MRACRPGPVRILLKSLLEQLLLVAVRTGVGTVAPAAVDRRAHARRGRGGLRAIEHRDADGEGPRSGDRARWPKAIVDALPPSPLVSKAEVAGPGFINFFLAPDALAREIRRIHELGDAYGLVRGHDLKLVTSPTNENPLYDVQYAHARVASAMKK